MELLLVYLLLLQIATTTLGQSLSSLPESFILFTTVDSAYTMNITGGPAIPLSLRGEFDFNHFQAVNYNWKTSSLFFTESGSRGDQSDLKLIMHYNLRDQVGRFERLASRSQPNALAVDTVSNVVYSTDNGEEEVKIYSTDLHMSKVLIADVKHVSGIAIDPSVGRLFLTASPPVGSLSRVIYMAYMDGSNLRTLINQNINFPQALTIDRPGQWLYWTDTALSTIEKCRYDGTERQTILNLNGAEPLLSLTQDNTYIYFTTQTARQIYHVPKTGGTKQVLGPIPATSTIHDLVVISPELQLSETTACSVSNGNCQHFCLPTPGGGRTCSCDDKFTLAANGQDCVESSFQRVLLLTDKQRHGIFLLDTTTGSFLRLGLYNLNNPTGISWDGVTNTFIWSSYTYKRIGRSCLYPQQCIDTIAAWRNDRHSLKDLEVDPFNQQVYLVDSLNRIIFRIPYGYQEGEEKETVIHLGIATPRGLALDLTRRLIFWTEIEPLGKIRRANTDGSGITTVIGSDMISPNDIVVEANMEEMYWCDGGKRTIEMSSLTGGRRRELYRGSNVIISLAIDNNYIYFSDLSSRSLHRINRLDGSNLRDFGPNVFIEVYDLVYIDRTVPTTTPKVNSPLVQGTTQPTAYTTEVTVAASTVPPTEENISNTTEDVNIFIQAFTTHLYIGVPAVLVLVVLIVVVTAVCCLLCIRRKLPAQKREHPKPAPTKRQISNPPPVPHSPQHIAPPGGVDNSPGHQPPISDNAIRTQQPLQRMWEEERRLNTEIAINLHIMQSKLDNLQRQQVVGHTNRAIESGYLTGGYPESRGSGTYEDIDDTGTYEDIDDIAVGVEAGGYIEVLPPPPPQGVMAHGSMDIHR